MHVPDKSVEPAAFSYVERRRPQSSHWSTKTLAARSLGGVTCLVPPQLRVRICDENSALAPDTAPLVMPRSGSRAARLPPCYPGGCNSTALRWTEREHGRHGIQVTYLRSRTALITSSASKFRMFSGRMMPASRQRHASRWNVSRNRCAGGRTVGAASNRPMP